ncbi:MAG TPA: 16S rRNA (adenine(1518)-N(6)/adenine(1519)-N(6))-dimethyltransferase RsmA [Solirubrobacteraceae bacterium]|nr:16S rRNA (adenine(1518)-N(6)/adenine(1519)-N(6))-dimethyltransferase RsmA [Solirubrobacteraceae bacterium]
MSVRSARQRRLGQNFLVDRNMLDVIERLAQLQGADVVLEVGAGAGALTERLARRAAHVHAVEVDERLREPLQEAFDRRPNVTLHFADALELELGALDPRPTKMISNLPYSVAATVLLRTIERLDSVREWVVMVQREVGERFAAAPGTAAYGAPSALAQLACEVRVLRAVSRSVFRPQPNVDSVLLGLRRREGEPAGVDPQLSAFVHAAFAHRRKALAGSLALSLGGGREVRDRARAALERLGLSPGARAEQLSAGQLRELAAEIGELGLGARR